MTQLPPRPDLGAPIPAPRRRLPWVPIVLFVFVCLSAGSFVVVRSIRASADPTPTLDTIASDYCHMRVELGGIVELQSSAASFEELGANVEAQHEFVASAETRLHELASAATADGDADLGLRLSRLGDAFGALSIVLEGDDYPAIVPAWRGVEDALVDIEEMPLIRSHCASMSGISG